MRGFVRRSAAHCAVAVAALFIPACSGGSGDTGLSGPVGGVPQQAGSQVVVRFDHNGDALPDLLTLDTTRTPFRIVEALEGTSDGGAVDMSAVLRAQPIDPAVSDALAAYLAGSIQAGADTELDVTDAAGREFKVTLFE